MRPVSTCHGELSVLVEVYRVTATVSGSLGTGSQPQSGGGGGGGGEHSPCMQSHGVSQSGSPSKSIGVAGDQRGWRSR